MSTHLQRIKPDEVSIAPETTPRLDEKSFLEPDFCVFPRAINPGDMRGYDVLLAIEVADTSSRYDLGRKVATYAAYGIPEVWVINALTPVTRVHRRLGAEGYAMLLDLGPDETLSSMRVPAIEVCLSRLGLNPASA